MRQQQAERKRRSKGEQTRLGILEAAMGVIAREGLRGVTHRSIAAAAGVQLSLTTYYFKDINALVEEAFALFCERSRPTNEQIWQDIFSYLDRLTATELRKSAVREKVAAALSRKATDIIVQGILDNPDGLRVEQALFGSALQSAPLRELASKHRQSLLTPLVEICRRFNRQDPELDAELLLDTMTRLEYEALLIAPRDIDRSRMRRLLRRQIGWALGVRRA